MIIYLFFSWYRRKWYVRRFIVTYIFFFFVSSKYFHVCCPSQINPDFNLTKLVPLGWTPNFSFKIWFQKSNVFFDCNRINQTVFYNLSTEASTISCPEIKLHFFLTASVINHHLVKLLKYNNSFSSEPDCLLQFQHNSIEASTISTEIKLYFSTAGDSNYSKWSFKNQTAKVIIFFFCYKNKNFSWFFFF